MSSKCHLLCIWFMVSFPRTLHGIGGSEIQSENPSNYSVVVDLGSSGSRVFVYKMEGSEVIGLKPKKISPGIASMAHNPIQAASYLRPIFEYAKELIPEALHRSTPFHLKATAGVRLLSLDKQRKLFDGLLEQLKIDNGEKLGCPFIVSDEHVGVISGDDEGFYAALSVNYLMGSVSSDLVAKESPGSVLFGALDMGGASTQIVFKPDVPPPADSNTDTDAVNDSTVGQPLQQESRVSSESLVQEVEVTMSHQMPMEVNYHATLHNNNQLLTESSGDPILRRDDFFSQSFLSFGADQIREKLWSLLIKKSAFVSDQESEKMDDSTLQPPVLNEKADDSSTLQPPVLNPCGFVGHEVDWKGRTLLGTGDAKLCAEYVRQTLFGDCALSISSEERGFSAAGQEEVNEVEGVELSVPRCSLIGYDTLPETNGVEFIAMSIYFFALDCMRTLAHLLQDGENHPHHADFAQQWPKPTINSLFSASEPFCALSWEEVSAPHVHHRWTWEDQMPHRCFETVFIATLLKEGYGVNPDERSITYALELEGMEVEWTLGYMLSKISDPFR